MIYLILFLFGLCIGSFLNVLIYRLPREEKIGLSRSFCPHCRRTIPWYDNIPLLSYLLLGGVCRYCKGRIRFRYFFVELLTASLLCLLWWRFGAISPVAVAAYAVLTSLFIVASFVDLEFLIIPDVINFAGIGCGLIFAVLYPPLLKADSWWQGLCRSFLGAVIAGGVLYLIAVSASYLFKKEAMGMGDVKLLAMIGAFIGWPWALFTIFTSSLLGSLAALVLLVAGKASLKGKIPFGPFLCLGALVSLFWGPEIIHWYLNLF